MNAGPNVNPEDSSPPLAEEAEAKGPPRSSSPLSWFNGWMLLVIFYPLSIMPAYVVLLALRRHGIDLYRPYEVFYWPVIWLLQNVPPFQQLNDLVEPVLRGLVK